MGEEEDVAVNPSWGGGGCDSEPFMGEEGVVTVNPSWGRRGL